MKTIIFFLLLSIIFFSCKKENTNKEPYTIPNYYPLSTGNYISYKITEINIDKPSNIYDTTQYFIKEIVDSAFYDITGNLVYKLKRFIAFDSNFDWQIKDIWVAKLNNFKAIKIEENIKFVKIRFPLSKNKEWDGNIYNFKDEMNYTIISYDEAEIINNINYDSVLTVQHINKESLIDKYYIYEKYAKKIGLVEKKAIEIEYAEINIGPLKPIEERIIRGKIYYQTAINYNY